jgi:hypothetical protein
VENGNGKEDVKEKDGVEGAVFVAYYMGLCDDSSDELNSQARVGVGVSVLRRGHARSLSGA